MSPSNLGVVSEFCAEEERSNDLDDVTPEHRVRGVIVVRGIDADLAVIYVGLAFPLLRSRKLSRVRRLMIAFDALSLVSLIACVSNSSIRAIVADGLAAARCPG